jgi:glycosyltransferase involved in cell wall biosynthesis
MQKEFVSVIIPTFNSAKTLSSCLESIKAQHYDQRLIEILVIDGGSADKTLEVAEKYGCKLLQNPKTQQEYAKHIGLLKAKGSVAIFLDSDEAFESPDAIAKRVTALKGDNEFQAKVVIFGGYKKPAGASAINDYINIFSDPFAYFMYGISTQAGLLQESWQKRFGNFTEVETLFKFQLQPQAEKPLVDMCAGNAIDLDYLRLAFQSQLNDPLIVPKVFYLIVAKTGKVALLKNDATIHYSADSLKKYVSKLKWRVLVNVRYKNMPGTGFSNREAYEPTAFAKKKYLFVPYALTVVMPLSQSILLAIKYKKPILLIHAPLTFFVGVNILWQYFLATFNVPVKLKAYGKDDKVLEVK